MVYAGTLSTFPSQLVKPIDSNSGRYQTSQTYNYIQDPQTYDKIYNELGRLQTREREREREREGRRERERERAVSYTHLTLPTMAVV